VGARPSAVSPEDFKLSSVHTSVAPSISLFEKREELRRVLESKYFANSPKKTRFLEFVSEQFFLGNGEKLNEYLIGVEVYDRGVDFNPQKDPIVRVQAHEIRRLLNKYYEEDGRDGLIRLDMPSGHYVPVFRRSTSDESAADAPAPLEGVRIHAPNRLHFSVTTILGTLCVVLASLLILSVWKGGQAAPKPQATNLPDGIEWFWRPFLLPAEAPLITIPNHPLLRVSCLSWKWRRRSSVKIAERTYEEGTEAFHSRRKSSHPEAASCGQSASLGAV